MIFAQQKVAVATCHASRCITVEGANLFYEEIIKNIFEEGMETLGEAVFAAKQKILTENTTNDNIYGPAVLQTILGDPALRLKGDPVEIINNIPPKVNINPVYAYPNPFTKGTNIKLSVSNKSNLVLQLYNLAGKVIKSYHIKGGYLQNIGTNLNPGIYFLKIIDLKEKNQKAFKPVKVVKLR